MKLVMLRLATQMLAVLIAVSLFGCGGSDRQFLSMGTAPVGGAFQPVGNALSETLNLNRGPNNWKVQAKGTKGSQENIRRLQKGELQLALSNSAITYFAVRGEGGWDQPYEVRALVTIAPNVGVFVTTKSSLNSVPLIHSAVCTISGVTLGGSSPCVSS